MSTTLTLQAALAGYLAGTAEGGRSVQISIPSGTVLTFPDASNQDDVAVLLAIISPAALAANRSQLDRTIVWPANTPPYTEGNDVLVSYGAHGERNYHDFAVSASPSGSPSLSPSASLSLSPSASASLSPSTSVSRSPSASPSAS